MKIKTNELRGPALDWAVAMCRGFEGLDEDEWLIRDGIADMPLSAYNPSSDWSQGGPIIEREGIQLIPSITKCEQPWHSSNPVNDYVSHHYGPTPLIAAMRCYVASKMGGEIEVPDELVKE